LNKGLLFVAKTTDYALNGVKVAFVDDESITGTSNAASASYNKTSRTLTVKINYGYTTANTIIAAINNDAAAAEFRSNFAVALSTTPDPNNDGSGVVSTGTITLSGGTGVRANATITPAGANNDLYFAANATGPAGDGVTIKLLDDGSVTGNAATAAYDSGAKTLTIRIKSGLTTAATIVNAVSNDSNAATFRANYSAALNMVTEPGNNGQGVITISSTITVTTANGATGAAAQAQHNAANFVLAQHGTSAPSFTLYLDGSLNANTISVTGTANNQTIADLIADLNTALDQAGLGQKVLAMNVAGKVVFSPVTSGSYTSLEITAVEGNNQTVHNLGFAAGASVGQAVLVGTADAPANGQLTSDATFTLSVNVAPLVTITLKAESTNGVNGTPANTGLNDLVADLNDALKSAGLEGVVRAGRLENKVKLSTVLGGPKASLLLDTVANDPTLTSLRFTRQQSANVVLYLAQNSWFKNLTMDSPEDVDWYAFAFAEAPGPSAQIRLSSASELDGLGLAIYP
jgi:hypothetical protein